MAIYGTLAGADSFFAANDLSGLWATYSDANKTKALQRATEQIDYNAFKGEKYDYTQTLGFPRVFQSGQRTIYFDIDTDGDIIVPVKIQQAAYIQAKFLLDTLNDDTLDAMKYGITSRSTGSTSESYDMAKLPVDLDTEICREASRLIRPFLIVGY